MWEKMGRIFVASGEFDWMASHGAHPKSVHLTGDLYRIFFSVRDSQNMSHIAYLDIDLNNPLEIIHLSSKPVLSPSDIGLFDDCGVIPSGVATLESGYVLYFVGISRSRLAPLISFPGVAMLDGTLDAALRLSRGPLLDRTADDPYALGAVNVHFNQAIGRYEMWYESFQGWSTASGVPTPWLQIKHATSKDGLVWERKNVLAFPKSPHREYISSPTVLVTGHNYEMYFSFKSGSAYRLGYAYSNDGLTWSRNDEQVGIAASGSGWDGEEIEYPEVFSHIGQKYLLYCGDGYGKTGFGIAKWNPALVAGGAE